MSERIEQLTARIAAAEARQQRLSDYIEIRRLQDLYQHYINTGQRLSIAALFANSDEVEIELSNKGIMAGRDAVARYFLAKGTDAEVKDDLAPRPKGRMVWHTAENPAIEINADGTRARGVWLSPGFNTAHYKDDFIAVWNYGKYDMEYVKQDGVWKVLKFRWANLFTTPYDQGWVKETLPPSAESYHNKATRPSAPDFFGPYDATKVNAMKPYPPEPYPA